MQELRKERKITQNELADALDVTRQTIISLESGKYKASNVALSVMLVTMYLVALVGGLWYPELTQILFFIISLFLVSYLIAYKMISRRV